MAVEDLFGNFVVRSDVSVSAGSVTSLARGTNDARHVVEIENWTTVPYDVEVKIVLPQGRNRLSFPTSPNADSWTANAWSLAESENHTEECELACGGSSPGSERIHCVSVRSKKAGGHKWYHSGGPLPLALTIAIT